MVMEISAKGNAILQFNEPWKAIKDDKETVKVVLNICLQYVTALSVVCRPFLPFTSDKLRKLLNLNPLEDKGELNKLLDQLAEGKVLLKKGHVIQEPIHLFTRIEDRVIEQQTEKLHSTLTQHNTSSMSEISHTPVKPEITYADFEKMDIRTATIIAADRIEKADKLLKLTLDLGFEKRTVVSGIAAHFSPEEVLGKKVCLLANLAPRTMRGVTSEGMILMAEDSSGKLGFVSPENLNENGMTVK
jgi:methionyl-tRNA synthetase